MTKITNKSLVKIGVFGYLHPNINGFHGGSHAAIWFISLRIMGAIGLPSSWWRLSPTGWWDMDMDTETHGMMSALFWVSKNLHILTIFAPPKERMMVVPGPHLFSGCAWEPESRSGAAPRPWSYASPEGIKRSYTLDHVAGSHPLISMILPIFPIFPHIFPDFPIFPQIFPCYPIFSHSNLHVMMWFGAFPARHFGS